LSVDRDLLTAFDPVIFARDELGFEPDPWQKLVLRSDSKRMIFNCCRQSGKSTTAAIKATHAAIFFPNQLILILSPSLRQSGEMFRKVSAIEALVKVKTKNVEDS
jgi:phage terminase large subunit-like protein